MDKVKQSHYHSYTEKPLLCLLQLQIVLSFYYDIQRYLWTAPSFIYLFHVRIYHNEKLKTKTKK
jgi:hypothetical protein